jgi:hypothetical protein
VFRPSFFGEGGQAAAPEIVLRTGLDVSSTSTYY